MLNCRVETNLLLLLRCVLLLELLPHHVSALNQNPFPWLVNIESLDVNGCFAYDRVGGMQ